MENVVYFTPSFTTTGGSVTTAATTNVIYQLGTSGGSYAPQIVAPAKPPKPETPEEWLRRRVAEVCWAPA